MNYGDLANVFIYILAIIFWGWVSKFILRGIFGTRKKRKLDWNTVGQPPPKEDLAPIIYRSRATYVGIFLRSFLCSFGFAFLLGLFTQGILTTFIKLDDMHGGIITAVIFFFFGVAGGITRTWKSMKRLHKSVQDPLPPPLPKETTSLTAGLGEYSSTESTTKVTNKWYCAECNSVFSAAVSPSLACPSCGKTTGIGKIG